MSALRVLILVGLACFFSVGGSCSWSGSYHSRDHHCDDGHCEHAATAAPEIDVFVSPASSRMLRSFRATVTGLALVGPDGADEMLYDSTVGVRVDFVAADGVRPAATPGTSMYRGRRSADRSNRARSVAADGEWLSTRRLSTSRFDSLRIRIDQVDLVLASGDRLHGDETRVFAGHEFVAALPAGTDFAPENAATVLDLRLDAVAVAASVFDWRDHGFGDDVVLFDVRLSTVDPAPDRRRPDGRNVKLSGEVLEAGDDVLVELSDGRGEVRLAFDDASFVRDRTGRRAGLYALVPGAVLRADGRATGTGAMLVDEVRLLDAAAARSLLGCTGLREPESR